MHPVTKGVTTIFGFVGLIVGAVIIFVDGPTIVGGLLPFALAGFAFIVSSIIHRTIMGDD